MAEIWERSECLFEDDGFDPYVCLHLCVSRGIGLILEECLRETWGGDEIDPPEDAAELLLQEIDDQPSAVLRQYVANVQDALPELFESIDIFYLHSWLVEFADQHHYPRNHFRPRTYIHRDTSLWSKYLHSGQFIVAPLLSVLDESLPSVSRVKSIVDALHMFASDLSQAKDVHNLKIDFDSRPAAEVEWLIRFAAVNCSELLLVSGAAELSRQIVSLRRVLPKSQLAAWCLRPTTTDSLTDGGTKLVHDQALIDPIRLLNFLGPMNVENAGVCLWELSAKLAVFRRQPVGMPQGIPSPIHAALVAALKQYGRASRLSDLKLAVGAENLNLHPLSLPPGRILAYAPSPKFLRRESAYYILSDWVADEERRRGKIRADRVVTPLIPVDWPALQLAMNVALKADDIYAHLGIAWLTRIANSVLKQLKYNPLNPYLKTCATQMLRKQLRHNHTWVGRGIFLGPRWSELAMSSQHISDLRLKVAQELKHEQHKVAPDVVEELTSQLIGKASLDR